MATVLGMVGTGDWSTYQRPYNWRNEILRRFPNGMTPLTAIMSMLKNEATDDPRFYWWEKAFPTQEFSFTAGAGVYYSATLASGTEYLYANQATQGIAGATLYVKLPAASAKEFRPGHQVLIDESTNHKVGVRGYVTDSVQNGASSYVAVELIEADDNADTPSATDSLQSANRIRIVGNANAEGAETPEPLFRQPSELYNYTQIFRNAAEITGTADKTNLRTGDSMKEQRKDALQDHSIEMEKAFLWGMRYSRTGANGKTMRFTGGIKSHITTNVANYVGDTTYTGTWIAAGKDWLNYQLKEIFKYGSSERLALCGDAALLGINILAEAYGDIQLKPKEIGYGIKVVEWYTPFGTIYLKTHPLFSFITSEANSIMLLQMDQLKYRYLRGRDTKLLKNRQNNDEDKTKDEYLTEAGLEIHHEGNHGYLEGVGKSNA